MRVAERLRARTAELVEFLNIPSEGGDGSNLQAAADWTADRLRHSGAQVEDLAAPPG